MKKILVHGVKEKTPMGFCDVPRKNLLDFLRDMKSISVPNEPRYKPLRKIHQAASEGDTERLQKMISLGKHSVHDRDFKQRTALHFACAYGHVEVVSVLLRNNCDIDAADRNSITPLMKAVQNWTYECVCTLLKHGADPNRMDKNGNTSLHYAVSEDNQTLAKCLLKYSANLEQKNKDGFTPLLLALKENKIEMAKFLVKKGANIHVFDEMKRNTLLYAIRWDSKDMVNLLLDEGIDFFFKDVFGWTALRYAIEGTSKGSREILMNYDEKLRRKNKNGIPEYKKFEDNSLDKHPNDPTSGSNLPKSSENACDFDYELDISKCALTTCPSNICGAGDQEDKSEAKATVDDSSIKHHTSKHGTEKADSTAYDESESNQEESTLTESDLFTTESLEENVSDDSENIQPLRGEGILSRKFHERRKNNAARKIQDKGSYNTGFSQEKVQVLKNPALKSSTKGKVSILNEVRTMTESHHFIIESDLEIESLEETFSYDNEDKQSVSDDGHFSGTPEWDQNDTNRQTTDSAKKYPNLKTVNERNHLIQNKRSENKDEETLNSELTIASTSEEEQECPDSRGKKQRMQTGPTDIVYLVTVKNQREENMGMSQEKATPEEHPEPQCSTEKTYSIANEESDTNQEDSLHADGVLSTQHKMESFEQVVELTTEKEQKKAYNNSKQCLNIFKRLRPKRIGSLFMTRDKSEENAIAAEEKEFPKEYGQLKSTTEEGDSMPNDSRTKTSAKSLQTESAVMFTTEKGEKCQLDSDKNNQGHMLKQSQPKMTSHLSVTEGQYDESTINDQVKVSINCVDSPQKPDVKSRLEEEHKSHGNGEKSQHEHMFKMPRPKGAARVYFGKCQKGENTVNVKNKDPLEQYSQCKATNERKDHDLDSNSSMMGVKTSCAEANVKLKTEENLDGEKTSQSSDTSTHIQPRHVPQLSLGLTSTPTNMLNGGGKGFQKKFLEWKPPTEMKDSDSTEVSDMTPGQEFPADVDIKLETESQDYLDSSENTQSSNTITSLQSKCIPQFSVGITSGSTSLLTEGEQAFHKKNPDQKQLTGSKVLASSEVSVLKHKQEFPPEVYLQMKTEESQKNLDRNENIPSSNAVIQPKQILHLPIRPALRPMNLLNEGKKAFRDKYPEQESSIEENYVSTDKSAVKCGQEFPAEADWEIKIEDFQENLDDNGSIQSYDSFTCLQPRPSPYLSLGLTQRPQIFLDEEGKGSHKKHPEWKKNPSTHRENSLPPESSEWRHEQEHPSEVDIQMKAHGSHKNRDGRESSRSTYNMSDLHLFHAPPSSAATDLLHEGGKEVELKDEPVKNQNNLESNTNIQPSDSVMHLPPRHILHSSVGISPTFSNPPNAGEEDLQMKLEENQRKFDGNESIQLSDNMKHLQPRRIRHLLMGLIPRPMNILNRRGKGSHKKCTPCKDPIEIKEFDPNAKLERQEIKTFTSVMIEDDQNLRDGSKHKQPLVEATRKKDKSNGTEDATQSSGSSLATTAHAISTASVVAAIVAATVVAEAAPAAAVAAASAAVAAVVAATAPAAAAVASATVAVDALADVAPEAALDSSAVPVAAATAAVAAAVPAAAVASAPDGAPAVVSAAAAAAAAAVAVTSVAAASLTAVSAASVAAVVAVAVTAAAGSDAPTVAPATAAVAAVAAATGPAAAAALVASVAATAVTPCVPPAAPSSAAAPSTVAAATAAASAVVTYAAASPAVAAAAAAAVAIAVSVPTGATAAVAAVASSDTPTAVPAAAAAAAATIKRRPSPQRKYVKERRQQSPVEEAEEQDGFKMTISTKNVKVLKPVKDIHDLNTVIPVTELCSAEYLDSPLKSIPALDSYKELLELKEINIQILTEKTKVENELSEVKEENSQLEKKILRKNERICTLRSIIKEQMEKKRNVIFAYNEVVEELRDKEEMIQKSGEQYNRQVSETQELEICLKTRDVELKQLKKEKEHAQKMEDHLQILELENTSLIATVKKQKEEIEQLQRCVQNPLKNLAQSTNSTETAAQENQNMWNDHTTVITEMENIIKSLKSEVSSVKISKEFSKRELEKYKRFYLAELRNKNFLLHELNRTNESREQSHTELHMKFQQNISASNTLNTRLVHECSCVEKTHELENKDFLPGENLVLPSSSTESNQVCMAHYPWTSEDDVRDLSEGLSDLKQSIQLSLETQQKQDHEVDKELVGIGKSFKMTDRRHEIGECGSHGDFETCQLGISTPATMPGCLAQATSKPYSEFLKESYTTSTINAMETKIRSLKSTLSKLKVSRALRVLELERYKYLYYEELNIRKSFQYYLNKNNENSEKNKSKLHTETQQSSSAVNAKSMRPLTECSSAGCFDSIPGPGKSLILRENQTASSLNSQPSTSGLEDCLKMMQQVSQ